MFQYVTGVLREFKYIRWLSVRRVVVLTAVVIAIGLALGFALGAVDNALTTLLRSVVI